MRCKNILKNSKFINHGSSLKRFGLLIALILCDTRLNLVLSDALGHSQLVLSYLRNVPLKTKNW
jgi:hypothetical protein